MLHLLCGVILLFALLPAALFVRNLSLYRPPPPVSGGQPVSVLIPARNEERSIEDCVRAVCGSRGVDLEIIVMNDRSLDKTESILKRLAAEFPQLRVVSGETLPEGWCGKQFACQALSKLAARPVLCFLDADVRIAPDGLARAVSALESSGASLVSGFPRQLTESVAEEVVLLMHFLLLGFLPIRRMRRSTHPAYAAGCGQLLLVKAGDYRHAGGHAAIRATRHDGIQLPSAFRRAGLHTDLFDMTSIASCRMYRSVQEVWEGLLKNAGEGLGAPSRIAPITLLLLGGQVFPFMLLPFVWADFSCRLALTIACLCALLPRIVAIQRFKHPVRAALLHPFSVIALLTVQWWALLLSLRGLPVSWKGRNYGTVRAR